MTAATHMHSVIHGVLGAMLLAPALLVGQETGVRAAWDRAVAEHFDVPEREVQTLSEWDLDPEELPMVLELGRKAGVSTEALLALRRGGRRWTELAGRYGLGAADFHVSLAAGAPTGPLGRVYGLYRETPRSGWGGIELEESELVALVNLDFVSEFLRVAPGEVLGAVEREGSFTAAFAALMRAKG